MQGNATRYISLLVLMFFVPLRSSAHGSSLHEPRTEFHALASGNPDSAGSFDNTDTDNLDCADTDTDDAPLRPSCCSRISNCLKRQVGWCVGLLAVGAGAAFTFFNQYSLEKGEGVEERYDISGGCTSALKIVLINTACATTCRVLMSQVQNTRLGTWLGAHSRILSHKVLGTLILLTAGVHTGCSVWNKPKFYKTHEGQTGLVMWFAFAGPLAGSYLLKDSSCLKKFSYNKRFLHPHQLGFLLFAVAYAIHRPNLELLPWMGGLVAGLTLDRIIEFAFFTHTTLITAAVHKGNKVILTVARPSGMPIKAGQFVYVKINGRYMPLTVAWFDEHSLYLVVGRAGTQTNALFEAVKNGTFQLPSPSAVSGPLSSPFQSVPNHQRNLVAAGGSGVSVTAAKLQKLSDDHDEAPITIIHSERHPNSFDPLLDAVSRAIKAGVQLEKVHFFLTAKEGSTDIEGDDVGNLEEKIKGLEKSLAEERASHYQSFVDLGSNDEEGAHFILHRGRLNRRLLDKGLGLLEGTPPHVLISGNPDIIGLVEDFCIKNRLPYTKEAFGL